MKPVFSQFFAVLALVSGLVAATSLTAVPAAAGTGAHISSAAAAVTEAVKPAAAGAFMPLTPFRQLDTRNGTGAAVPGAVGPWSTIKVKVTGRGGIPATGVAAVAVNVTVTSPGTAGNITAYAGGTAQPGTSNLNFTAGQTIPNLVNSPVGADGTIALTNNSGSTVHLIADTAGYYLAGTPVEAGAFSSLTPYRQLDTRNGTGAAAPGAVGPWATIKVKVTGRGGIPATGVSAVAMNVTVTSPGTAGNITAHAGGTAQPGTSNLNFTAGQTIPNLVNSPVGADGTIALTNNSGSTVHLIADTAGYYLAGSPVETGVFTSLTPFRQLDTRNGTGGINGTVAPWGTIRVTVTGRGGIPATGVSAVAVNVTVTSPGTAGNITAYAGGTAQPGTSNLNFTPGETIPNLVSSPVAADGSVALTNNSGSTVHLIADTAGYHLAEDRTGPTDSVAPVAAAAAVLAGPTEMDLSWSNPSGSSYAGVIIRRTQGTHPPTSPTAGSAVTAAPASATTFRDTGLSPNTSYTYAFFARDAANNYAAAALVRVSTPRVSDISVATNTRALLNTLVQRPPEGPAFQPGAFGGPVLEADGCTAHQRFILNNGAPWAMATPCTALFGQWTLLWDVVSYTEDPSQLGVAYTVPFEEAWHSGAWAWTPEERRAFANDTFAHMSMEVMTLQGIAARGASDPARWWPPFASYRCKYVSEWVAVKTRWNLSIDPAEYNAILDLISRTGTTDVCGNGFELIPPQGIYPGIGPASVVGTIGAPSGTRYDLVSVQAYDSGQSVARQTQVRMDGTFELTGLPPGNYTIKFLGGTSGTDDQWYSELGPGGPATVLTLPAGHIADVISVGMIAAS